jgi:CubicO group peptidase (beta-lactamase class C family)
MRRLLTTAYLFVVTVVAMVSFMAPAVFGQVPKSVEAKRLIDDITAAKVDKLFEKWDKPDSPGCALGIVKDGKLIYKRGYGMADLDHNVPITSKTVMDIMSQDKQFTAMSILLLSKQGKLSLDDEIHKYLPKMPRYQNPITIRHLIHHTSGVRDFVHLAALAGVQYSDLTANDERAWIMRQKELNFKPGEMYLYSNSEYILLDLIVKRVSGKAMPEFAEENIFKPLGMSNTRTQTDRTMVVKNRATGYFPRPGGGFTANVSKRGAMDTTVEDLFLWDQNFYNNKLGFGPDLVSEQLTTGMLNNGEQVTYAFGLLVVEYNGLKVIGHGGGGGGFNSAMFRYPEQNFSVMCLCNAEKVDPGELTAQVADIFLADQFKKAAAGVSETVVELPPIIIPEKELASFAGTYFEPITPSWHSYYMKDAKLMMFNSALSPLSQNRFKVVGDGSPGLEIVFVRPTNGGPVQVKHITGGKTQTWEAVQGVTPTSAQLSKFTGKYVSDDLAGAIYTLIVKDEKLLLEAIGRKDILLTPVFADAFSITGLIQWYPGEDNRQLAILRFTRDKKNAITGFLLSRTPEGPKNLRFNKL